MKYEKNRFSFAVITALSPRNALKYGETREKKKLNTDRLCENMHDDRSFFPQKV
jgi:hypothetical protein